MGPMRRRSCSDFGGHLRCVVIRGEHAAAKAQQHAERLVFELEPQVARRNRHAVLEIERRRCIEDLVALQDVRVLDREDVHARAPLRLGEGERWRMPGFAPRARDRSGGAQRDDGALHRRGGVDENAVQIKQ